MEDKKEVIKLNTDKELTVNISSLEDLLNSIKYATSKMEQAKEGLTGVELQKDFSYIKDRLDLVMSIQKNLRDVVFEDFQKDTKKTLSNLPREDTVQALIFELNRFNKVDVLLNKISIKNTIIYSMVMSVLVVAGITYSKVIDDKYESYLTSKIRTENFIISKKDWIVSKNDNYTIEIKRKSLLSN